MSITRKSYLKKKKDIIKFQQSCCKALVTYNDPDKTQSSSIIIQNLWRKYHAKMKYMKLRAKTIAIQSIHRMYTRRKIYIKIRTNVIKIQQSWRKWLIKRKIARKKTTATATQSCSNTLDINNPIIGMTMTLSPLVPYKPPRASSRLKHRSSYSSSSLPIGELKINTISLNEVEIDDGSCNSLDQPNIESSWLVPKEVKYTRQFAHHINRSKHDPTPLPRVLRVKHYTLLLYTKPTIKLGHLKNGLFAMYIGESQSFVLNQDIDIGIYGNVDKKQSEVRVI